jgi:hypothetical protein
VRPSQWCWIGTYGIGVFHPRRLSAPGADVRDDHRRSTAAGDVHVPRNSVRPTRLPYRDLEASGHSTHRVLRLNRESNVHGMVHRHAHRSGQVVIGLLQWAQRKCSGCQTSFIAVMYAPTIGIPQALQTTARDIRSSISATHSPTDVGCENYCGLQKAQRASDCKISIGASHDHRVTTS